MASHDVGYCSDMSKKNSSSGEPSDGRDVPASVSDHELLFGREWTSGYLTEHGEDGAAVVEACAERVTASTTPSTPLEQRKPSKPLRV